MDPTLFPVDYLDQERKALGEHVSSANISAFRSAAPQAAGPESRPPVDGGNARWPGRGDRGGFRGQIHAALVAFQFDAATYFGEDYDARSDLHHRGSYRLLPTGSKCRYCSCSFINASADRLPTAVSTTGPTPRHRPNSRLEAAYHRADKDIQKIGRSRPRTNVELFLSMIFEVRI